MLRRSRAWFHYSVDYRIGTRYMGELIADEFKRHAMKLPLLREGSPAFIEIGDGELAQQRGRGEARTARALTPPRGSAPGPPSGCMALDAPLATTRAAAASPAATAAGCRAAAPS